MKTLAPALLFAISLLGCAITPPPTNTLLIFDPELRLARREAATAMMAPRQAMTTPSGVSIHNCHAYLSAPDRAEIAAAPANRDAAAGYVLCDSLALLQEASAAPSDVGDAEMGRSLATRLDLRSFRSSRHQLTTDDAFTLEAVAGQPLDVGPRSAELESPDWYFKLEVIAVADIDGSGKADWLVRVVDQSLKGSYFTVSSVVVVDPVEHRLLEATAEPLQAAKQP